MERWSVTVSGLVQGVGFRPFLYNLALNIGITGWVRNNSGGVELEIQGNSHQLATFLNDLKEQAPSAAIIETISTGKISIIPEDRFAILSSELGQVEGSPLPDQGICADCSSEFSSSTNRRYLHPFNSCTICGPRFTIVCDLPFDRPRTTMDEFELCPDCRGEYGSPSDRRFHAQTIACPKCGPTLWFTDPKGTPINGNPAEEAKALLVAGGIIGIKGIGGYHLACLAFAEQAVERLRLLKGRDNRAFAVMFRDLSSLRDNCESTTEEEIALTSPARPILLMLQKESSRVAGAVNPGLRELGAFLPYTGIQLLLFDSRISALVMTSGNRSGEPLTIDDSEAVRDLGPMVDGFLVHNRRIQWRCDDSVLRVQQGKLVGIRRSRGFAPAPVRMDHDLVPLLACGAQQKNVFALTKGDKVYLSPHQGDLDNLAALVSYQETIEKFKRLLKCQPEWVVHDLHPDYHSTLHAMNSQLKKIGVQHHLAHVIGVVAAQRIIGPVIGVAFDGSGYGTDAKVWGGEFFVGAETSWQRMGHLGYYPLPGGEAAVREPWRMVAGYLHQMNPGQLDSWLEAKGLNGPWAALKTALKLGINAPLTSSAGRLFDGIAALVGGPLKAGYEGEAAIWLENQADRATTDHYQYQIETDTDGYRIDPGMIMSQALQDIGDLTTGIISMKFHRTMAVLIGEMAELIRNNTGCQQVVLTGGVFQNRLLLELTLDLLKNKRFQVFIPEVIPINDGGIALGQAWLGSLMIERGVWDVLSCSR